MKQFFKYTLASLLGSILTFAILIGILIAIISAFVAGFSEQEAIIDDNSVLKLRLATDIPDKASDNPFSNIDFISMTSTKTMGLNNILKNIEKAKKDDKIKGIFLDVGSIPSGLGTVEEIRNKLIDFKESGKFIIAYSSGYTQKSYYLASVADKIYLNPEGSFDWKGLYSQVIFFKGALDKLGIEAQIFRHGQFKSAVEPFFTDKMSEASKLQTITLIQSIWDDMCTKISKSRNIEIEKLNLIADSLWAYDAKTAKEYKFVDGLVYYDEVLAELKTMSKSEEDPEDFIVSLGDYASVKIKTKANNSKDKIAVIFAEGEIIDGGKSEGSLAGDWMAEIIREVREDEDIKAVVLRVNSPGGSGLASDIMWREITLTKEKKPVVVSMGNLAASGGYYIACPANYIFALPSTLTGSIGVFGMLPNVEKLMTEKLGITVDGVGTNAQSDFGQITRKTTTSEANLIQNQVEEFYDTFIQKVADGRGLTKAEVDSIGQGRVWSGLNAIEIGLVDEIGGLNDAVAKAASLANLSEYRLIEYPQKEDAFETFIKDYNKNVTEKVIKETLNKNYKFWQIIKNAQNMSGIQARMEYELEIN
ncbi:MAG TPA: signal peptide peptidase SppA [Bacteroidales bacterium]|jgi:protease-4|nr:MAG: Protease 4 [Bacteroidetes bacterium ADurb.Bin028]HOE39038.1 signal peptide peptidase SppA [Bacteroidales bacterium]HOR60109.1 signal peptide peptidase SppA [Bacteroidales bacterium]HPL04879.1 signal peptide peptidase SppA [Bacteroidales bacterium]